VDVKLTASSEDYLEAICQLAQGGASVRSVDLANKLEVSKASVNKAVATLKAAGMIEQEYYGEIVLTAEGRAYGESVRGRHRMLLRFLVDILGVDPQIAEHEACEMEHAISDNTMDRWLDFINTCPLESWLGRKL
jgi:DtxR family transcriptional regulator, Mn-dependent transcriptional regulator